MKNHRADSARPTTGQTLSALYFFAVGTICVFRCVTFHAKYQTRSHKDINLGVYLQSDVSWHYHIILVDHRPYHALGLHRRYARHASSHLKYCLGHPYPSANQLPPRPCCIPIKHVGRK